MSEKEISGVVSRNDAHGLLLLLEGLGKDEVSESQDAQIALCLAASSGHINCVKLLLKYGVKVDSAPSDALWGGDTPLMMASRYNQLASMETCLEYGANIYSRNGHAQTAMDIACEYGHSDIIELLLSNFTWRRSASLLATQKVRKYRHFMYTALVASVSTGQVGSLRQLLYAGFDLNLNRDNEIGTPLHAAIDAGSVPCAELLIQAGANTEALRKCCTPMAACAENNQVGIAKLLLRAGCDPNNYHENCSSPLTIACHYGCADMAEFLLDNGADPNATNHWGFTALFMAVDSPNILRRMLQEEVEVDKLCGERGEAAIHLTALIGSTESMTFLLESGADINLRTPYNETAIWVAVWKHHEDMARLLIAWNCDTSIPSNGCREFAWKYLPLEVALGSEQFEVAKMLIEGGSPIRNPEYFPPGESQTGPLKDLPMLRLRNETLLHLEQNPQHKKWFIKRLRNANLLKCQCRHRIRGLLSHGKLRDKVKELPLPRALKQYLLFYDLWYEE